MGINDNLWTSMTIKENQMPSTPIHENYEIYANLTESLKRLKIYKYIENQNQIMIALTTDNQNIIITLKEPIYCKHFILSQENLLKNIGGNI